jgi:5-hydroxyisourate hydrolase
VSQITTHVLDTAIGRPAAGIEVTLSRKEPGTWQPIATGRTNEDGRVANLLAADSRLEAGIYRMRFATGAYLEGREAPPFYPFVDVVFALDGSGEHYHIPLLLSPFGYSTYRGS